MPIAIGKKLFDGFPNVFRLNFSLAGVMLHSHPGPHATFPRPFSGVGSVVSCNVVTKTGSVKMYRAVFHVNRAER